MQKKMLLCDQCDLGYHMYCLEPPLNDIPDTKWYCIKCEGSSSDDGTKKKLSFTARRRKQLMDSDNADSSNR